MKVIVVGSGFGGIKAALELVKVKDAEVTLISQHTSFEYHAALYRSATGWSPMEVVLPLRDIFGDDRIELVQDTIAGIDVDKHTLSGESGNIYPYERAVFAIGQSVNYYGIAGMSDNSFALDSIAHTIRLRQHLREQVTGPDPHLKFVVIGGGASGVELAGEIEQFVNELAQKHGVAKKAVDVILLEGSGRLLPALAPKISRIAERRLNDLGVEVRLNTAVKGRTVNDVQLEHEIIKTHSVIWTAGFMNNPFFAHHEGVFKLVKNGRVEVDEFLRANQDIYVIGDSADTQYSGMAQTAIHDGAFVARNVERELKGKQPVMYVPKRPIYAVPVGRNYAVLQWGSWTLWGKPAWFMRRLADFRLFDEFEPLGKAIKTWRAGQKRAEWLEVD